MKNILITGGNGFVGKNLVARLDRIEDISISIYDIDNSIKELEEYIEKADFVFHLAGINRPLESSEFDRGNRCFTELLLNMLEKKGNKAPVLITSSIQATMDNPYGISKKLAEEAAFKHSNIMGTKVYVYRLPNLFGKWCRPNYNSVVATYCHNIANNLSINIDNPDKVLTLSYIDDVVEDFIDALDGKANVDEDGFCSVKRIFEVTLKQLAETLYNFSDSRKTLILPNFSGEFERYLYATYISYLPDDGFGYNLDLKFDKRGWLAEFIKSKHFGQIFLSRTKPGITRGNHWHHTKVEKFLVVQGEALIRFRQIYGDKVIEYKVSGEQPKVVDIPVGYTHSITNVGDSEVITLFWADEIFDANKPDTFYLEA